MRAVLRWLPFVIAALALSPLACGDDDDDSSDDEPAADDDADSPDDDTGFSDDDADDDADDDEVSCDGTVPPIVFAHGFLEVGDAFAAQTMRFASNGYCRDRIYAFDWNTLYGSGTKEALAAFVDAVLAETGAAAVDLIGHSAGGGLSLSYLRDEASAGKVAHYAHVASFTYNNLPRCADHQSLFKRRQHRGAELSRRRDERRVARPRSSAGHHVVGDV
ncbi:MAG: alpha/beta fold hydrolase [Deltaproteobacteria bacterium]|nr:alpha/beta fold hydrolase [Deltaproteobacteria bacterium]